MLYEVAEESGATINFNSEVMSVDPHCPSVVLSSGEVVKADIIIGADGAESLVRSLIVGKQETFKAGPYSTYS